VTAQDLLTGVHWSARTSAVLFALSLAAPLVPKWLARPSEALYVGFVAANTVQFYFVTQLALATGGANMFPGGRSLADVGGWPSVLGIFTFFYVLALMGWLSRRDSAKSRLRAAGVFSRTFIGFMFVSTYIPLIARSPWYALPCALVAAAVVVDVTSWVRACPVYARSLRSSGGSAA
jgi:hypothetical protein